MQRGKYFSEIFTSDTTVVADITYKNNCLEITTEQQMIHTSNNESREKQRTKEVNHFMHNVVKWPNIL